MGTVLRASHLAKFCIPSPLFCENVHQFLDDTARKCIMYLREQHFSSETFLPLSTLEVITINETLRDIPDAKLAHDIITLNVPEAQKAVQLVCGNSLVTETAEIARQLAFGTMNRTDRYRVVSLDGIQFQVCHFVV